MPKQENHPSDKDKLRSGKQQHTIETIGEHNSIKNKKMGEKSERQRGKYKIGIMAILLAGACILIYYFHVVLGIGTVFTHLFYIPIILAAIWWKRKGLVVAVILMALLVSSHIFLRPDIAAANDYLRAFMFIVIAFVVAKLSENITREEKELRVANQQLRATELQLRAASEQLQASGQQFKEANIQLKELDRLKSMFIASMSHELRTPLNSIIGFTGIMLLGMSGELTVEQRKQLMMVKSSAAHLLALINDVIDVSKIESGKVELAIEEFDLSAVAQEVKKSFEDAGDKQVLKIMLDAPKSLVIKSDKRRTKQIIMNLLSNAVKFTDKGKIDIKVEKKVEKAEVSVTDTGIGIRKEDISKLFKPFSRIYSECSPIQEGTGLGLYLSKKLADLLGAEIKAESEFGRGSEFTVSLPLRYYRLCES